MRQDWFTFMQQDMERLLDNLTRRKPPIFHFLPQPWQPAMDIYETPQSVILVAELAGVREEDIKITVTTTTLTLRGQRQAVNPSEKRECYQLEIYWGSFERVVNLPSPVNPDEAKAVFRQGVLEVVLPKVKQEGSYQLRVRGL